MKGFKGAVIGGVATVIVFSVGNFNSFGATPAAPVKLAWSASPDTDVAGYKVCYGVVNSMVTNRVDVGSSLQASVANLLSQTNYFFYVVAYGTNNVESTPSNSVQFRPSTLTPVQLAIQDTGAVQVQFRGPANSSCTVQYIDSLGSTNWTVLGSIVAADDGTIVINDSGAANVATRFYRAVFP